MNPAVKISRSCREDAGATPAGLPSFSKGGNAKANWVQAFRHNTRMNERNFWDGRREDFHPRREELRASFVSLALSGSLMITDSPFGRFR